jgi:glyoxylase-like metal-dependent hydrolase (beta-lactamase superfamily II)/ferredoxin
MANVRKRRDQNVSGDFFVDSSCIDCGTCRWVAPASFDEAAGMSRVWHQPAGAAERKEALKALIACPVAAIGSTEKEEMTAALAAYPDPIAGGVYHCGYHSEKSYGAASYLIVRERGNVLIDSPRFAKPLVERIEALGGVSLMFLTHRDDVADHTQFAKHFGCERMIHADDRSAAREAEQLIEGYDPVPLDDELVVIPVPGHTRGSMCLLYRDRYLFTGDHLRWNPRTQTLGGGRSVCWYDWTAQTDSMARLVDYPFEWILPGHGQRYHADPAAMKTAMTEAVARMRRQ